MYQGSGTSSSGYGGQGVVQSVNQAAQIMQRQMSMGAAGVNMGIGQTQTQATPMPGLSLFTHIFIQPLTAANGYCRYYYYNTF